jgi:hypothetical protein
MASAKDHPEDTVAYFIVGDKLALVTTDGSTDNSIHEKKGDWKSIDESVSNGVLIHYYAEPNAVSAVTDYPDIDNSLHGPIVDFVKSKLYIDRAGKAQDPNVSATSMSLSQFHNQTWTDSVRKHGSRKRDKIGGTRVVKTFDFRQD